MYLLRRYLNPYDGSTGNRSLMPLFATLTSISLVNAWIAPAISLWMATALSALAVISVSQRPSAYETALPISGRDIAAVRLLSSFGLSVAPLFMAAIIVALHTPEKLVGLQLVQCVTLIALGNLLPRLVRPREFAIETGHTLYPLIALLAVAISLMYLLPSWVALPVFVGAAAAAGAVWWRVIPETFQAAGHKVSTRRTRTTHASSDSTGGFLQTCLSIGRTLYSKYQLFQVGLAILAGASHQWLIVMSLLTGVDHSWRNSNWMRALPFSHRARLWMVLVPGVVFPFVFVLLGMQLDLPFPYSSNRLSNDAVLVAPEQDDHYYGSPTEVSLDHWVKAADGHVPVITAPWGETVQPFVLRIFGSVYYNPYSERRKNSERFTEWQFQRLTKAAYGYPISRQSYWALRTYPQRGTNNLRMVILYVSAALTGLLLQLLLSGVSKYGKPWAQRRTTSIIVLVVYLVPLGFIFYAGFVAESMGAMFAIIRKQLMSLSEVLPANTLIVFFVALIPVVAAYSLLEWQFARSEMTIRVTKKG